MNQNIIRMFNCKKVKHNSNKESHLWVLLQQLSNKQQGSRGAPLNEVSDISIKFAPDGRRARNVVSRANYRMTGKQPSKKNDRMVHWESHYEKKAFQLLEVSPYVKSYIEQPAVFEYKGASGEIKKHFPDIYVQLINGVRLFIEIKSGRAKDDQELLTREARLKNLLSEEGFKYIQVYPDQIESFHYQENVQNMLWHINSPPPYPVKEKIIQFMSIQEKVSLGQLIGFLFDPNSKSWIFSLIVDGLLQCDLSVPLLGTTLLSVKGG